MLSQLRTIRKMGNIKDLLAMIPGFAQMKDMDIDEKTFKHIEAIILSMTPEERRNPVLSTALGGAGSPWGAVPPSSK
jgi:signal recognition particle subunit SRP54